MTEETNNCCHFDAGFLRELTCRSCGAVQRTTIVVFRKWNQTNGGDIIALFPEEVAAMDSSVCSSYMHLGQHSAASVNLCSSRRTVRAREDEYKDLAKELTDLGYVLEVKLKAGSRHYRKVREAEIKRLRNL